MATDRPLTEVLGDAIERARRDRRQEGPTMPAKYRKKPVEIEAKRFQCPRCESDDPTFRFVGCHGSPHPWHDGGSR